MSKVVSAFFPGRQWTTDVKKPDYDTDDQLLKGELKPPGSKSGPNVNIYDFLAKVINQQNTIPLVGPSETSKRMPNQIK